MKGFISFIATAKLITQKKYEPPRVKTYLLYYAKTKGSDQLRGNLCFHFLDSMIRLVSIILSKIPRLSLASVTESESGLIRTPKDRFSCYEVHIKI